MLGEVLHRGSLVRVKFSLRSFRRDALGNFWLGSLRRDALVGFSCWHRCRDALVGLPRWSFRRDVFVRFSRWGLRRDVLVGFSRWRLRRDVPVRFSRWHFRHDTAVMRRRRLRASKSVAYRMAIDQHAQRTANGDTKCEPADQMRASHTVERLEHPRACWRYQRAQPVAKQAQQPDQCPRDDLQSDRIAPSVTHPLHGAPVSHRRGQITSCRLSLTGAPSACGSDGDGSLGRWPHQSGRAIRTGNLVPKSRCGPATGRSPHPYWRARR